MLREQRRRALELTWTRLAGDLARASVPAHRHMLEQAIADIEKELSEAGACDVSPERAADSPAREDGE